MAGAGTHLHNMIREWSGLDVTASCGCQKWINRMDRDIEWAKHKTPQIVAKLIREAKARPKKWKLEAYDEKAGIVKNVVRRYWKGLFWVAEASMLLEPFLTQMVNKAIALAEEDARNGEP
jgi:hypothetical protein